MESVTAIHPLDELESDISDKLIAQHIYPIFIYVNDETEPIYGYVADENGRLVGGNTMAPVGEMHLDVEHEVAP